MLNKTTTAGPTDARMIGRELAEVESLIGRLTEIGGRTAGQRDALEAAVIRQRQLQDDLAALAPAAAYDDALMAGLCRRTEALMLAAGNPGSAEPRLIWGDLGLTLRSGRPLSPALRRRIRTAATEAGLTGEILHSLS